MRSLLLLAFLGVPLVRAHLTASPDHGLRKRIANLEPFRLQATAEYTNSLVTKADAFLSLLKRDTSVETATQLIKATVPGVEFRLTKSYTSGNGVTHVYFKQTLHGLDIDNANFNVNIKDGKVFSFGNNLFAAELPAENPLKKQKFIKPVAALASAISTLDLPITFDVSEATIDNAGTYVLKGTFGAEKDPEARLVYFVKADGTLALTWRVETDILDNWLLTYVDAVTTEQVYGVVDYVAAATYQVYPWGVNDPTEGSRSIVTDPWDIEASEFTWQSDGANEFTVTRGNNAVSLYNPSGNVDYFAGEQPDSSTQDFHYYYSTDATDPLAYRNASITQLFYTANVYHDLLHSMGFDEAAGNFEFNNNRAGGLGDDLAVLYSQHWGGLNNAVFSSPPDGTPGRMFMYMWSRSVPRRDGSFDAGVVIHEYTHGLSSRLTGGASDATCLSAGESSGLGEGWGDFMATAIRLKPGDTRNTNYAMGAWVNNNPAGLRQYLYSTSMTTNPDTYATNNDGAGSHRMGSVWAVMLYEVMWNLIEKYGKNDDPKPIFVDGVPTDGKYLTMQLVVDGMKLQPCNPNFVQARDAILDADVALTGGINACEIWTGFAKRGLGSGARYGTTRTVSMTIPSDVC